MRKINKRKHNKQGRSEVSVERPQISTKEKLTSSNKISHLEATLKQPKRRASPSSRRKEQSVEQRSALLKYALNRIRNALSRCHSHCLGELLGCDEISENNRFPAIQLFVSLPHCD